MINTIITIFPGLPNLNFPLPPSTPLSTLFAHLATRLPLPPTNLILSTTSGRILHPTSTPLSSISNNNTFITLRLTHPLCGGKGGFGSQLRAAGGRMSSRKKSQENSDSCRNLDGRRMRTVKEAKALAALLEVKPEMEKKEREARMKRWRDIVETAERREEGGDKKRFDDTEWLEGLEEGKERTREAVLASLKMVVEEEESSGESSGGRRGNGDKTLSTVGKGVEKKFAGWDDGDDEFMSSDEEMEDVEEEDEVVESEDDAEVGKGKGKAKA
ncbi:telomere stability and silencing-domain-containing protein [Trichophaea hybrida]|nr:telomere stability and silencing-domain-containing protein [Trichophaea hybrida]